jgi:hypothetical protein
LILIDACVNEFSNLKGEIVWRPYVSCLSKTST